jgi:hypothetical protein
LSHYLLISVTQSFFLKCLEKSLEFPTPKHEIKFIPIYRRIMSRWIFGGGGILGWIDLAQDRDRWRALVNALMNIWAPWSMSVCDVCPPTLSFQGTAHQLVDLTHFDFSSVARQYIRLEFRRQKHFTDAFLMPVQPFAVDLGTLKGPDSPFSQVDDILTFVLNCGLVKINTQPLLTHWRRAT